MTAYTTRSAGFARKAVGRIAAWFLLPLLLVLLWWASSLSSGNYYMTPPNEIATTFGEVWTAEAVSTDVLPSVARLLSGFAIAAVLGTVLGMALGLSPRLRALTEPVLEFFRAIPPPVLVPLLMLLIGVNTSMKLAVIISGCVWPILLNTIEGVRAVDPVLTDTCRCYGIRGRRWLTTLVLRSASPQIMAGLRQGLSIAIILMVISEMFASNSGLGYAIQEFQRSFAIPEMWTGIVLLGLLGVVLSVLFGLVERRVLAWYHGMRAAHRAG
ncbi:MAG: ABC transporter permease subunit [Nocardiopsaceae bacterium]|nr:ABC transporter permease subunit [Nocardiopsaceae bacterium]